MNNQQDRAIDKAIKNIKEFLQESPEGSYLSQITGKLMINNELAKRALSALNAVFENGMYTLPVESEGTKLKATLITAQPVIDKIQPVETVAKTSSETPIKTKKPSKMELAEQKVLQLLKDYPDGFTRQELQAQANLNSGQVYNAIHSIRKHTALYTNEIDNKSVYSLTEIKDDKSALLAPVTPKPAGKPLVEFNRIAPSQAENHIAEEAYTQATSPIEIESEADFKCSMSWSDGTSTIQLVNCIDPILVEAVLDYIHEHQGRAA